MTVIEGTPRTAVDNERTSLHLLSPMPIMGGPQPSWGTYRLVVKMLADHALMCRCTETNEHIQEPKVAAKLPGPKYVERLRQQLTKERDKER